MFQNKMELSSVLIENTNGKDEPADVAVDKPATNG